MEKDTVAGEPMTCCAIKAPSMPYSSPLDMNFKKGTYACAGCDLADFSSDTKYDSRTGWPSFWKPLAGAVLTQTDTSRHDDAHRSPLPQLRRASGPCFR